MLNKKEITNIIKMYQLSFLLCKIKENIKYYHLANMEEKNMIRDIEEKIIDDYDLINSLSIGKYCRKIK